MVKHQIAVSEESHRYIKSIQTKHKLKTKKHIEYSEIVDTIITKAEQWDTLKDTQIHTHVRRNLKEPVRRQTSGKNNE